MKNKFNDIIYMLNKGKKHKEIVNELGVSIDQVKKVSRLNNTYMKLEHDGLDLHLLNIFKSLKYKALLLSKLFDNLDALKEVLISIDEKGVITSNRIKEEVHLISQIIDSNKKDSIKLGEESIIQRVLDYNKVRINTLNYLNNKGHVCTLDYTMDECNFDLISFDNKSIYGFEIILNNDKLLDKLSYYKDINREELAKVYTCCNKFYIITLDDNDDNKKELNELVKLSSKVIGIVYIKYDDESNEYKISKIIEDDIYQELDRTQLESIKFQVSRNLTEHHLKTQLDRLKKTNRVIMQST